MDRQRCRFIEKVVASRKTGATNKDWHNRQQLPTTYEPMKGTSISTITNDLSDGSVINCFVGTLTKLYEFRTIQGQRGEWTKQNGEFKDAAGQTIPVEFRLDGKEVSASWKGKTLIVQSVKGDKGTHGVKVFDDVYQGKTTRKLIITNSADISFLDDRDTPREQPREQRDAPREQAPRQQPREQAPRRDQGVVPIHGATVGMALNQASKILTDSVSAADRLEYFLSPRYLQDLYQVASGIVRVSQHMERGHLAPKLTSPAPSAPQPRREPPPPRAPEPTPEPEPESYSTAGLADEDDIPF